MKNFLSKYWKKILIVIAAIFIIIDIRDIFNQKNDQSESLISDWSWNIFIPFSPITDRSSTNTAADPDLPDQSAPVLWYGPSGTETYFDG